MFPKNPHWPKHSFCFLGGGGPQQPAAPAPVPAPPVTTNAPEVIQAEQDLAQQNLIKKSVKNTIYAGDTPYNPAGPAPAPNAPGAGAGPTTYRR